MDARTLLIQQWASVLDKEEWFPPLEKVLENVTLEQAVWKPADGTMNSIWELVCHLLFYEKRYLVRFLGNLSDEPKAENNNDTFRLPAQTPENWYETKQTYFRIHRELGELLVNSSEEDLYRAVPNEDLSLMLELKSLALHGAYHLGQIVFLCKMQGARPENRSFN